MASVSSSINELVLAVERIKQEIREKIRNLPDNPRITRLSSNAYTINIKDLGPGMVLGAEYHDFKYTYEYLILWIDDMDIKNVVARIEEAIKKGYFRYNDQKFYLHPDVREYLKGIL